jgi:beta-lactamase regulating signal transducer with metallopeptidase domain
MALDRLQNPALVLAVWGAGCGVALSWLIFRSLRFSLRARRRSRELDFEERQIIRERCARLARWVEVDFRMLSTSEGPAISGFMQTVLLLPVDFFSKYSEQQQTLMLSHELEHLCRRDLMALYLARLYRCVFWFNPLAWLAERYVRLDQELSCDERVVSREGPSTRRLYGETMLLTAQAPGMSTQAGPNQANYPASYSEIRQRTSLLRHHRRNVLASSLGIVLLFAATSASVVFGALGSVERDWSMRSNLSTALAATRTLLESEVTGSQELAGIPARLGALDSRFFDPPLNDRERAEVASLTGLAWLELGRLDRALDSYRQGLLHARGMPGLRAKALIGIAEVHYAKGDYVASLEALVRAQASAPLQYTPDTWALRGLALAKMEQWDQALICITRAIDLAGEKDHQPRERWLLAQTALRLNQGDLDGAVESLNAAMINFEDTPHETRLLLLNEFVQESWQPRLENEVVTGFLP